MHYWARVEAWNWIKHQNWKQWKMTCHCVDRRKQHLSACYMYFPVHLIVHNRSQAHNADVNVVFLTQQSRVLQRSSAGQRIASEKRVQSGGEKSFYRNTGGIHRFDANNHMQKKTPFIKQLKRQEGTRSEKSSAISQSNNKAPKGSGMAHVVTVTAVESKVKYNVYYALETANPPAISEMMARTLNTVANKQWSLCCVGGIVLTRAASHTHITLRCAQWRHHWHARQRSLALCKGRMRPRPLCAIRRDINKTNAKTHAYTYSTVQKTWSWVKISTLKKTLLSHIRSLQ